MAAINSAFAFAMRRAGREVDAVTSNSLLPAEYRKPEPR